MQETLAAGRAKVPDAVDQRETQLLKELGESLPSLKSNAEQFIQLSDSFSRTEGEFVQKLFEPLAGCGKIVRSQQFLGWFKSLGSFRAFAA